MAPIKFEEHIKEQLEERTLQPSNKSWDELSSRLETEEKKQSKTAYWWIGLAASFAILIAIALPFFNNENEVNNTQPVLVDTKDETTKKETPLKVMEVQKDNTIVLEDKESNQRFDSKVPNKKLQKASAKPSNLSEQIVIVETPETSIQSGLKKETITQQKIQTFEEAKIVDVVAEIKKLKNMPSGVSDQEIDSLLKIAHREILNQRLYNETTKTVDADALLLDVEEDLEQSFRTKVFEALKTNYSKVKTAVAERNN